MAQARVNSRPLVATADSKNDENLLVITPQHLKIGKSLAILPSTADQLKSEEDINKIKMSILDRWQARKVLNRLFFVRWQNEYLQSLQKFSNESIVTKIKEGDVVLLLNERVSSEDWPLGVVTKVLPGHDGIVRSVVCKRPIKTTKNLQDKIILCPFLFLDLLHEESYLWLH